MSDGRQTAVGLALAAAIVVGWAALQGFALFAFRFSAGTIAVAALIAAALCWLNVGLFIVAHDAMHGSLAPGRPPAERARRPDCAGLLRRILVRPAEAEAFRPP